MQEHLLNIVLPAVAFLLYASLTPLCAVNQWTRKE